MTTHSRTSPPPTSPQGRPTKLLSPALTVAALMSWLPSVVLVWVHLTWSGAPERVPTHWSGSGVVDGWGSTTLAFWSLLVPGLVGALICSALSVVLATDTSKVKAASAIGITSAATGAIASFWFMMVLSATGSSVALLPVLAAIIWGALVFVVCLLRHDPASR